jgi:hypothetical protein
MADILDSQFTNEHFQTQQNVNPDNMNTFYQGKDQRIAGYFSNYNQIDSSNTNQVGSICNGVGVINPTYVLASNFGQSGTSKTFVLAKGIIRFIDQDLTYPATGSGTVDILQAVYANYAGGSITLDALPTNDGTKYYCVAEVTIPTSQVVVDISCTVNQEVVSQADLITDQSSSTPIYVALFWISSNNGTSFTIGVDKYCANNYNEAPQYVKFEMDFRLSDSSTNPLGTNSNTGSTTLYLLPYGGNNITLFKDDQPITVQSSGTSLAISTLADNTQYSIYAYLDTDNTVKLDYQAWSSGEPAFDWYMGKLVKNGDTSRLYIGIVYANNLGSGRKFYDWSGQRLIRNFYNKQQRMVKAYQSGNWTYSGVDWQKQNNDDNPGFGRIEVIMDSTSEELVITSMTGVDIQAGTEGQAFTSLAIDTDTTPATAVCYDIGGGFGFRPLTSINADPAIVSNISNVLSFSFDYKLVGFHFIQKLEKTNGIESRFYDLGGITGYISG